MAAGGRGPGRVEGGRHAVCTDYMRRSCCCCCGGTCSEAIGGGWLLPLNSRGEAGPMTENRRRVP